MSWLFSQALVAEYSQATCWAGAPCAQLSVMPTPHKFWRNDKTVEPSDLSRFGLTCAALTDDRGEDLLTWFRGASLARTSALPAEVLALKALAAACGATWRGSLAKFDPASCTWRTAQPSLLADSEDCSVIWPRSGMTAGGQCWELPTLARPTSATGSGLLVPTPLASDGAKCASDSLARFVRPDLRKTFCSNSAALWPTLTVCGNYNRKGASANSGDGLATAVKNWPTPTASLGTKGGRVTPRKSREGGTLIEAVSSRTFATPTARDWRSGKASEATMERNSRPLSEQIGGLLNPTWVEWLMGWPIGWTVLEHSAMDRCPGAQPQPGACSLVA
jgi:hypothetical protein